MGDPRRYRPLRREPAEKGHVMARPPLRAIRSLVSTTTDDGVLPSMASSSSASRNPFLSPSQTASSQSEPPNIHTAFANINLANPQPASSPSSRNPFLDAHRSPYSSGSQPPVGTQTAGSSPFSDKDLDFLDGTSSRPQQPAVVVVEEARRKGGEGLDSEEGLSESERREWEQHLENERRESERGRGGDPGAVSNGDYQGAFLDLSLISSSLCMPSV
jgi:hypothetical protein